MNFEAAKVEKMITKLFYFSLFCDLGFVHDKSSDLSSRSPT